jgi:8-oxo-dGTP pyrophosphatase MutT (NUDIX family)/GNAT superfamily N-acetyltransferase
VASSDEEGPRTGQFGDDHALVNVHQVKSRPNTYYLHNLWVNPDHRDKGIGSRLMKSITDEHDANGSTLALHTDQPRLQEWYKGMGFEPKERDVFGQVMERPPRTAGLRAFVAASSDEDDDLSTKSPAEIDARLGDHHTKLYGHQGRQASALEQMHHAVGDRQQGRGQGKFWQKSHQEVLNHDPSTLTNPRLARDYARNRTAYDSAGEDAKTEQGHISRYDNEFHKRGGWSRFFLVPDGHIHSSMQCHSCRPTTPFSWLPNLSGKSEGEAVEQHGPHLCTHCFKSAPTEWKRDPAETRAEEKKKSGEYCEGGKASSYPDAEERARRKATHPQGKVKLEPGEAMYTGQRGGYQGRCPTCKTIQKVKNSGEFYQHKPPEVPKEEKPKVERPVLPDPGKGLKTHLRQKHQMNTHDFDSYQQYQPDKSLDQIHSDLHEKYDNNQHAPNNHTHGGSAPPATTVMTPPREGSRRGLRAFVGADASGITVAGLAVVARDTGRVLMLQRLLDGKDPAGGTWEWPGGHIGQDESPIEGAIREWKEEVGQHLPEGHVGGSWDSKGMYQGFVYVIPSEDDIEVYSGKRPVTNPDDPKGDNPEAVAWWDPKDLPDMPALRPECKTTDWSLFKPAAIAKVAVEEKPSEPWYHSADDYEGAVGDRTHITRNVQMDLPTHLVAHMPGVMDERPGEHRNMQGDKWEDFKNDISANGIKNPLFITVDHGQRPRLSEGNHRRDAAIELGLKHVPAQVRYYGHAERDSDLEDQARKWWTHNPQHLPRTSARASRIKWDQVEQDYEHSGPSDYGGAYWITPSGKNLNVGEYHSNLFKHPAVGYNPNAKPEYADEDSRHVLAQGGVRIMHLPNSAYGNRIAVEHHHPLTEGQQKTLISFVHRSHPDSLDYDGPNGYRQFDFPTGADVRKHLSKEAAYDLLGPGKGHYFEPVEEGSDWCAVCGHDRRVTKHPLPKQAAAERQYLYHTSPVHNRASITEKGLLPNQPGHEDEPELPKGVYLDSDEKMALDTGNDYGEDVWKVDVTGLKHHVDPYWEGVAHRPNTSHYVKGAIPPHRVTLHRPASWHECSDKSCHLARIGLRAFVALVVPKTFFHGTTEELQPGDVLHPGNEMGLKTHPQLHKWRGDHVWATPEEAGAWGYSEQAETSRGTHHVYGPTVGDRPRPRVYEVEPMGPVQKRRRLSPFDPEEYTMPSARVLRSIDIPHPEVPLPTQGKPSGGGMQGRLPGEKSWENWKTLEPDAADLSEHWELSRRRHPEAWAAGDKEEPAPETDEHQQKLFAARMAALRAFIAVNSSDEVPPPMGESPIPEGHVRLFHQTSVKQAESVRQHGLTMEHARDVSGPRGVWASHGTRFYGEGDEHATVEFHVPYDELRDTAGGQSPHRHQPQEDWEKSTHHTLIIPRSIKPHEISAIHLPWHNRYHYFHDNGMTDDVKKGEYDNLSDMKDYGPAIDKIKHEALRHLAMQAEDEVPPRLGTAPIPEDHVRLYHHTWSRNVPGIREHGLLAEMGQGDSGKGYGNEASAGVWAASQHPEPDPQSDRHVIEFHAHPREIDVNGPSPGQDIHKWQQGDHNVLMRGSVPKENILAIHAPWHTAYHQISEDARDREDVKGGKLDWVHNDPSMKEISKAVHKIQSEAKKTRNTEKPQQCNWCKQPATKSMLWAEGMGYIPTCDKHEAKTRDHIENTNDDEVVAIHQIKQGAKQPYIGKGWWLTPEGKKIGVYDHYETTPGMARQMIRPHMAESGQVRVRSFNNQLNVQTSRPFTDAQRQSLLLDADKHSRMFVDVLHPDTEESIHSESGGPEDADRMLARAHRAAIPHTAALTLLADQPYAGGHTFQFIKATPKVMGGSSLHELRAYPEGESKRYSGSLRWSYKSGEIAGIDVDKDQQRQGLATELLGRARDIAATTRGVIAPKHSDQRTNEGEAWARSTGDRLPRRLTGLGVFVAAFGQPQLFDPGSGGHEHLPNPRGGLDWHHGTPHHFESFEEERPEEDDPYGGYDFETGEKFKQPHWNTHLGQHWTSLPGVAEHFAKGQYGQYGEGKGHVITANLGVKHPKDYKLESHMDKEAFEHAWDGHDPHDYHDEFCHNPEHRDDPDEEHFDDEPYHYNDQHERGDEVDRQVQARYRDREQQGEWLSQHPDSGSLAESFKDKVRQEGHDGITYGNELEGPHGHQCAITFDEHQIHNPRRRALGKLAVEDYDTLYHITDQHHFALDPEHAPQDNAFAIQDRSHYKGLYATKDPDTWRAQGYHRPYVAELHVPHGLAQQERWHGESFIPAEHFDKVKVNRVIPFDAHQREKWGEPGTIESYHGTHYQTNQPLKKKPGWESSDYYEADENEPATKDVRDFTPKEHTRHLKRLREYLHHVQGWGWNEFNQKHEHVGIGEDEQDEEGMPIRRDQKGQPMTRDRYAAKTGPIYYHGHGRGGARAATGDPEWDDNLFVSHDPEVAKLYGPKLDRIQMAPDTKVARHEHWLGAQRPDIALNLLRKAKAKNADVIEFHKPHDFVGHIILNKDKIVSREPYDPGHTAMADRGDYGMEHSPHLEGPALHELGHSYPDIYDHPEYYGSMHERPGRESARALKRAKGIGPDDQVSIYRAAPHGVTTFNHGDWVTLSPSYAQQHSRHPTDESRDMPIYKAQVAAKHVHWDENDINEFGYSGPEVPATKHLPGGPDAPRLAAFVAALDPGQVSEASPEEFHRRFSEAMEGSPFVHHVTNHTPEEIRSGGMRPLTTNGGDTGVLVHDHGDGRIEATGLYNRSKVKGAGVDLLKHTMEHHGVNYVEAYGPRLPQLYRRAGFQTTEKYRFDREQANPGWDFRQFDSPSYHIMHPRNTQKSGKVISWPSTASVPFLFPSTSLSPPRGLSAFGMLTGTTPSR